MVVNINLVETNAENGGTEYGYFPSKYVVLYPPSYPYCPSPLEAFKIGL
jgi:hypothetical protein